MTLKMYLVLLATDASRLAEFFTDPAAAAEGAGLSKEDRAVLFAGDQNLLYAHLTADQEGEPK